MTIVNYSVDSISIKATNSPAFRPDTGHRLFNHLYLSGNALLGGISGANPSFPFYCNFQQSEGEGGCTNSLLSNYNGGTPLQHRTVLIISRVTREDEMTRQTDY
ncbi:hypothetical protein CEXT_103501 [Caerostris extrusa]|uniref:Uncharacterized protein n=1 Tax=Caerostris extrusa TaxID=172846 RepID=A0AAV4R128_CAEEX|nr:hypothetical protein CEXT_103501 [Caerostris extrusa]